MAKGAGIKFISYPESVPKLLSILHLEKELKKYDRIVLKPSITSASDQNTPLAFTESVLKYIMANKNPVAEVYIAEGADGEETQELFQSSGYEKIAEQYGIGLIDLNNTETQEIEHYKFHKFDKISYPKILLDSFLISLVKPAINEETEMLGSLSNMLGAFPASHYQGFFASKKNKIRKHPIKFSIHDIVACKMPDFAIIDNSQNGSILAGLPLDIDKQVAKNLNLDWKNVTHLKLIHDSFAPEDDKLKKQ